ncbi:MAG TPA: sulfite exporter TauE/SafE family protein [Gemmatimonadaceae bacterium]|nr:sulfite exporter TauE/SafE family protein [Gemmatimonadaceae bacterium]
MTSLDLPRLAGVVLVSAAAGAINSIAGGGTLLTFPALVALGLSPIVANATSTVALVPGSLGSVWGYRRELAGARRWAIGFAVPTLLGGIAGALLLLVTRPALFDVIVPWLVFGATLLFVVQRPAMDRIRARAARRARSAGDVAAAPPDDAALTRHAPRMELLAFQFFVATYGGYFGAGAGIVMLGAFGLMGLTNIHRMNGLKNWGGACMNAIAAVIFAASGLVNWQAALCMAGGAMVGGYSGSKLAQRIGPDAVRATIVGVGFLSTVWLLARNAHAL